VMERYFLHAQWMQMVLEESLTSNLGSSLQNSIRAFPRLHLRLQRLTMHCQYRLKTRHPTLSVTASSPRTLLVQEISICSTVGSR
jgi:hypothetical protein